MNLIRLLALKFIRGLHHAETGEVLGPLTVGACIVHSGLPQDDVAKLMDQFETLPIDKRLGPGLWYRRHRAGAESLWAFRLWGHITMLAFAKPQEPAVT